MKFPGTCAVCGKGIAANEVGLWAKGAGVKHEGCALEGELDCAVCGRPAGCAQCEFRDSCDIPNVSRLCICRGCSQAAGARESYARAVGRRFPTLGGDGGGGRGGGGA